MTFLILIAEDNEIIVEMLKANFDAWGYRYDVTADGESAIAMVKAQDFQLIFMDILLVGMSGIEAARAIRALPEPKGSTPIVALTGGMAKSSVAEINAAEFDLMVQKPVLPDELKAIIERFARR